MTTVKQAIAYLETQGFEFLGQRMVDHPRVPANCNYGGFTGGLSERRYFFTVNGGHVVSYSTASLRNKPPT